MDNWRDIPDTNGRYQVSNDGRIRSWYGKKARGGEPRLMNIYYDIDGYPKVSLTINGSQKHVKVGRLVLLGFIGYPPPGTEMFHVDGNRTNSNLDNLKWETHAENNRHRRGWKKTPKKILMPDTPKVKKFHWAFSMGANDLEIVRSVNERRSLNNLSEALRQIINEWDEMTRARVEATAPKGKR